MRPDWECGGDKVKERALSRFIIDALDMELEKRLRDGWERVADTDPADVDPTRIAQFVQVILTSGLSFAAIDRLGWIAGVNVPELARQAANLRWHGFFVSGGEQTKTGRPREHSEAFYNAADDVPRIRALFLLHWKRRNRMERPTAEEIASERWQLSADEQASLIVKFQRKSGLSEKVAGN